MIHSLKAVV